MKKDLSCEFCSKTMSKDEHNFWDICPDCIDEILNF